MVRNRKQSVPGTSAAESPRRCTGLMDGYIASQPEPQDMRPTSKMAPTSPDRERAEAHQTEGDHQNELALIRAELAQISSRMLTKDDTGKLAQEIRAALREELTGLRTDLTALEERVDEMETVAQECSQQHHATETAITSQGTLLLTLRWQVEDLELNKALHG
ncbi:Hypothetical predicted protein [Pelobates cultripes]|uniref:Uncharacterized protein n=1 Tax=Pelobates cultripes TaxID=61616 RepID=A0AAD1RK45_PELCU|nr:Hypothetical predicted protein [Pelobates cultripes]